MDLNTRISALLATPGDGTHWVLAEQAIEVIEETATDFEWSHVEDDLVTGKPSDKAAVNILKALLKAWARMHLSARYWKLRDYERVEVEPG